ncbi:peptidoglycan DD-metalloendopeptidase family protein [Candidatus Kaiserbacteria bacterium]|nr:peptidoglycan DD-metalloendopeptidase family protein [Candidatus Kaiserbacteria bacterium]
MNSRRLFIIALACLLGAFPFVSGAQSAEAIQSEIDEHNKQITLLNKEIAQYETQLNETTKQKSTLQNKISQLDLQRKKITASINVTKNKIRSTELQIQQLSKGIAQKQTSIEGNRAALGETLRKLRETEGGSLVNAILASENMSNAWEDVNQMGSLQDAVHDDIGRLATEKQSLSQTKATAEDKRAELLKQQKTLSVQQGSLDATRKAQNDLLAQTKSQESTYQQILAQKRAQEQSFEQALQNLQSKLQFTVSPDQIPAAGRGILRYPLDNVRITQYFGNTPFAMSGAYNGKGHNGVDFAASIGTPVKVALSGTILGSGNTDSVRGCYSFGKWVMVKHSNGLNTMYAHLTQINVTAGEAVATGQVLGFSGETGYATGPHLHFGVYVSAATQIMRLGDATKQSTACSGATMPIVPISGYLNPMSYF